MIFSRNSFANILSAIWEVVSVFLGKGLYLLLMVFLPGLLYDGLPVPCTPPYTPGTCRFPGCRPLL